MDTAAFEEAVKSVSEAGLFSLDAAPTGAAGGIGTLREKAVHAVLKRYFERHTENHEVTVGSYVADIVGEDGVIEIQTGAFDRLDKKLGELLEASRVTVVYPVSQSKTICTVDESGEIISRKSPKKGSVYTLFDELYKISRHLQSSRLRLCVVLMNTQEYRKPCPRSVSRKGWLKLQTVPTALCDEIVIDCPDGLRRFLPDSLPPRFASSNLAKALNIPADTARRMLYTFHRAGLCNRVGKQSRAYLYEINESFFGQSDAPSL